MVVRATTSTTATAPFNILDVYTGAAAAYSLRKLRGAYSGAAVRVRRSNDNAEQDIGFDANGNFNESALTSFIGANSGFVTTWYDQSGNTRNATQTTAANQPRIVNAGVVDKVNGIPSARFASNWLDTAQNIPAPSGGLLTIISALPSVQHSYRGITISTTATLEEEYIRYFGDAASYPKSGRTLRTSAVAANMPSSGGLVFSQINNGSNHLLYRNRQLAATAALSGAVETSLCACRIGAGFITQDNYISENIIFPRVLTEQEKLSIENNAMSYYGIV